MRGTRKLLLAVALVLGCGGDASVTEPDPPEPPPPPPPPPPVVVATVSVTPDVGNVVPLQTVQLSATTRDGSGNVLTDRPITWASTSSTIATVANDGLVTALSAGSVIIIASSEGKADSASISVTEGGFVAPDGGTVGTSDNSVVLTLPAGAVSTGLPLTITPTTTPPVPPAGTTAVKGTTYEFGPDGTQFTTPVTVTIKYDPAMLPAWVLPSDLVLQRWNGTAWSTLTDVVVNPVAKTVTGKTPGFSTVGVYFRNPTVTITPGPGLVNSVQRSVTLTAEVSGEGRNPDALQIEWSNTGVNGTLDSPSGPSVQYTAVTPILPDGDLDGISVTVRGQFEPGGPFELLGEAHTTVRSDLDLVVQMQPARTVLQYSQSVTLTPRVVNRLGNEVYDRFRDLRYRWDWTNAWGNVTPANVKGQRSRAEDVTYTARPPSQQSSVSPKGDKVTVQVILVTYILRRLLSGGYQLDSTEKSLGTVEAFIQIIPQYQITVTPASATIDAGQSAAFQVKFEPAWQESEQLFYEWRNSGGQGTISVTPGAPVTQGTITYQASSLASGGTEFIDVDVFVGTIGKLGSARASVSVNPRKTEVEGELYVTDLIPADAGRSCVWAYIRFPLADGARAYDMNASGFNDTLFWGTSIKQSFNAPLPVLSQLGPASGTMGGEYLFFLTGGCGPNASIASWPGQIQGRFAGMKVIVTVKY